MARAHELDTVELTRESGGFPAGTIGAVVSAHPSSALVEVVDGEESRDLFDDLVSVSYEDLRVVQRATSSA